ncbi:hypothetical protein Bca52824_029929 [Brassica carinata]|uniref:Uncharacterized protein n=1 Tax=Brassica carinata TaxID=52824 RepID=A0A8X7S8A2_BRACI|nr:hypothetical protein Bca52824_029929 [Brassica carinata]
MSIVKCFTSVYGDCYILLAPIQVKPKDVLKLFVLSMVFLSLALTFKRSRKQLATVNNTEMGKTDRPPQFTDSSLSPRWAFLYVGLLVVFIIGLIIYICWKRWQTSAGVTPVGDLEMAHAAP